MDEGKQKETGETDLEDTATEMVRGEKHPEVLVKVHSESRCCISAPGRELCDRPGYPRARKVQKKGFKRTQNFH